MIIQGRHIHGMKGANRSIRRQKKHFSQLGLPGAERFYNGTINIDTSPYDYAIGEFDYFFSDVQHKSIPRKRVEDFGFIVIEELQHRGKSYREWGYLYFPHGSPHFEQQHIFELLGPELLFLKTNDIVKLILKNNRLRKISQ